MIAEAGALWEAAPAKLNLYLHVVGRRADGYHFLDSLVSFTQAGDALSAEPADSLSLTIDGPFAAGLSAGEDNLVIKAARGLLSMSSRTSRGSGADPGSIPEPFRKRFRNGSRVSLRSPGMTSRFVKAPRKPREFPCRPVSPRPPIRVCRKP